jgi:hypothetical protein
MLLYSKSFCGLPLAFSFNRGSPLTRNLLLPALSVALTAILWLFTCRHVPEILSAAAGNDAADGKEYEYGHCVVKVRPATASFAGAVPQQRLTLPRPRRPLPLQWFFHPFPYQARAFPVCSARHFQPVQRAACSTHVIA